MIRAATFVAEARRAGYGLATGVPCSDLGALAAAAASTPEISWVNAANEGDAVAIASGAALGGVPALVLTQNSGLGNAVNPLTSLCLVFRIPLLLVIAWRGEPGAADEPQHAVMGRITPGLLELMGIGWERLPADESGLAPAFARAADAAAAGRPYAFVAGRGTCEPAERAPIVERAAASSAPAPPDGSPWPPVAVTRRAAIAAVQEALRPDDVLLATTGFAGREMAAGAERPGQLAMVGSMGCVASLGLGLARVRPERRVVVLDGDGAALMRLGALPAIAAAAPANLVHVLLDNGVHDSTGGQPTAGGRADLGAVAAAAGYPRVERAATAAALASAVAAAGPPLAFVHARIAPGGAAPPRPATGPVEAAARLRRWLGPPVGR